MAEALVIDSISLHSIWRRIRQWQIASITIPIWQNATAAMNLVHARDFAVSASLITAE